MYDFLVEIRNYSIFLAFIASSFRVTEEDWLSETDLSGPPSFFCMFSLLLKELIFIFFIWFQVNVANSFSTRPKIWTLKMIKNIKQINNSEY